MNGAVVVASDIAGPGWNPPCSTASKDSRAKRGRRARRYSPGIKASCDGFYRSGALSKWSRMFC